MPGLFITFEGVEGSGKSSRCDNLLKALREKGCKTVFTREPGGPAVSEYIRSILLDPEMDIPPLAELMLYFASRAANVEKTIMPALRRGAVVLCDRFSDATVAYQGYGRGLPLGPLRQAGILATGGLVPDLTVLMDLAPEEGFRRVSLTGRKLDRIEKERIEFHRKVRKGYLDSAAMEPDRFLVVDGFLSPDEQDSMIIEEVTKIAQKRKVFPQ
ncbi:dTMP kinase [Candidatus Fermentibacteria bacterium]|nr:MAG: dTMP kinase [Candidatus Fermentibacteria bacterium]